MIRRLSPTLCGILIGAAAVAIPTQASAQDDAEEITVIGRYEQAPDSVRSLSAPVSYADLDLSTDAGKDILHRRLTLTARYLCEKLGETETTMGPGQSCRQDAVDSAMERAGTLQENFAPRGTTWVAGPAWDAPYPDAWESEYRKTHRK